MRLLLLARHGQSLFNVAGVVNGRSLPAFVLATLVYAATVYGRYHYAFDRLASIANTTLVWFRVDRRVPA